MAPLAAGALASAAGIPWPDPILGGSEPLTPLGFGIRTALPQALTPLFHHTKSPFSKGRGVFSPSN